MQSPRHAPYCPSRLASSDATLSVTHTLSCVVCTECQRRAEQRRGRGRGHAVAAHEQSARQTSGAERNGRVRGERKRKRMGHERRGKYTGPYLYPLPIPIPIFAGFHGSVDRRVQPDVRVPPRSRIPDDERQIRGLPPAPTTSAADTPSPGTQSAKETDAVCVRQAASRGVAPSACLVVVRRASPSHSLRAVSSVYRRCAWTLPRGTVGVHSSCRLGPRQAETGRHPL